MDELTLETIDELTPNANDFRRAGRGTPLVQRDGKYVPYRRASSAGKVLDEQSNLVDWAKRTIIVGAAQRPDLMAEVSTLDATADKGRLRDITEECLVSGKGQERAITGTAIHRMLDLVDTGAAWTAAPHFQELVTAYVNVRDGYGLVPVDVECKCVNDPRKIAGTMDRRYQTTRPLTPPDGVVIPAGSVLAGDTKTGKSLEYAAGSYATQLAAYVDSVRYDPSTDERTAFDPPTYQWWAVIFHLNHDDTTCTVHWVNLTAGRMGLDLAGQVHEWRKRTDLLSPARAPLHIIPGEVSAPSTHPDLITALDGAVEVVDLAALREWVLIRLAAIKSAGEGAIFHLQRIWPPGVPGMRHQDHTEEELDEICSAMRLVEREWQVEWAELDPRKRHASNRWAKPLDSDKSDAMDDELRKSIHTHPRRALLEQWSAVGMASLDPSITDRLAVTHALYEFAMIEGSDADISDMLDGTLRAMGYSDGITQLGHVPPEHAPLIMASAFAITSGTALLLIQEDGKPVVRNIVKP